MTFVKNLATLAALLFFSCSLGVCQSAPNRLDSSTPAHWHKVSCLCGAVQVCSGDICLKPSGFDLDDDVTVELRDKTGTTVLDSKKAVIKTRKKEGITQAGTKVSYDSSERRFCFEGKQDGKYQVAIILFKNGVPQRPAKFPTNYSHKRHKPCDRVYMVEPTGD